MKEPIKCCAFIPNSNGGYLEYGELSESEREDLSQNITDRMGRVFNDHFSRNTKAYAKFTNEE